MTVISRREAHRLAVGLLVFLIAVGVIVWRGLRASLRESEDEDEDLALCYTAALVAALVVGLVDHYFFNPQFPHMVTLFWVLAGAIVAIVSPLGYERTRQRVSSTVTSRTGVVNQYRGRRAPAAEGGIAHRWLSPL